MYSARVGAALAYSADGHAGQARKGKDDEAYLSHILQATAMVVRYGGSEDQMIAAALHDLAEDQGGAARLSEIRRLFGPKVAAMVRDCSDALVGGGEEKPPWPQRKVEHLDHMRQMRPASVLVSTSDKIANLTDIADDLQRGGEEGLPKFNTSPDGVRAYYSACFAVLAPRLGELPHVKAERAEAHFRGLVEAIGAPILPARTDPVAWFRHATA